MDKTRSLTLDEGIEEFDRHLAQRPITLNTRKAFTGDVRIFARHVAGHAQPGSGDLPASGPPLAAITSDHVRSFLAAQERGSVANNPKSVERRLTSLKVFFKWLQETGYIAVDPADRVAYKPLLDPLPSYLTDAQAAAAVEAARKVASGERLEMRPLTAIVLVLETGIKKSECLALTVGDVEHDDRGAAVWVRYPQKRLQFKNRRLAISAECLATVDSHVQRYEVRDRLFDCTGRNLEYIFNRKVAPLAGLEALTFEMLRWTCAVRDYRSGQYTSEQSQVRYGLSEVGWLEMQAKLDRLIYPDRGAISPQPPP